VWLPGVGENDFVAGERVAELVDELIKVHRIARPAKDVRFVAGRVVLLPRAAGGPPAGTTTGRGLADQHGQVLVKVPGELPLRAGGVAL
jgi:hypothetical protein